MSSEIARQRRDHTKTMTLQVTAESDAAVASHDPEEARQQAARLDPWTGWGTALKPAFEPIVLARKPLQGTVAANVAIHGTGALNIGACRIDSSDEQANPIRKWPTNVFIDHEHVAALGGELDRLPSRFFWISKPPARERINVNGVTHPTVKPFDLMRELVRLVTPPKGLVLDPFAGSGTTLEAALMERMRVIGVEREGIYQPLIQRRIERAHQYLGEWGAQAVPTKYRTRSSERHTPTID